ncbi:hypothetical protein BRADI_2g10675v3 [Brachypodium distachyon]|uniref:Uncharacterized protein n=1 Tax=Brachypodium distachyon TaxID=15368 RepID=A0A0Q3FWT9_BRADI|nr:hypothetical protein BRADI_2g10675v3 [Brachypodium distachyon]
MDQFWTNEDFHRVLYFAYGPPYRQIWTSRGRTRPTTSSATTTAAPSRTSSSPSPRIRVTMPMRTAAPSPAPPPLPVATAMAVSPPPPPPPPPTGHIHLRRELKVGALGLEPIGTPCSAEIIKAVDTGGRSGGEKEDEQ